MVTSEFRAQIERIEWVYRARVDILQDPEKKDFMLLRAKAEFLKWPDSVGSITVLQDVRDHVINYLDRKLSCWRANLSFRRKFRVSPLLRPIAWCWSKPIEAALGALDLWMLRRWPLRWRRWEAHAIIGDVGRMRIPDDISKDLFYVFAPPESGLHTPGGTRDMRGDCIRPDNRRMG